MKWLTFLLDKKCRTLKLDSIREKNNSEILDSGNIPNIMLENVVHDR